MQIIDAHAHAFQTLAGWGADGELRAIGNGQGRWATGEVAQIVPSGFGDRDFTAESLLRMLDENGVEKAVLMQGGFLGFANDYVYESIHKYPRRLTGSGTFDPYCRHAEKIFTHLVDDLAFRIFKFEVSVGCGLMGSHPDFPLDGEMMMPYYAEIAKRNGIAVFDLGSPGDGSNQPKAIANIATHFPSLRIVICHLGSPRLNQKALYEEGTRVMHHDNVYFDLAALFWKVRPEVYPFPTAQGFVRYAKECCGADHLLWGSDAPSTVCRLSYQDQINYFLPLFSDNELERVFHDNAEALYFGM